MSNGIGVMHRSSKQEPSDADCILSEGRHDELATDRIVSVWSLETHKKIRGGSKHFALL